LLDSRKGFCVIQTQTNTHLSLLGHIVILLPILTLFACDPAEPSKGKSAKADLLAVTNPEQSFLPSDVNDIVNPKPKEDLTTEVEKMANAKSSTEQRMKAKVMEVANACGNEVLTVSIDWSVHDTYDYTGYSWPKSKPHAIESVGAQISSILDELIYNCRGEKLAKLYKKPLMELKHIQFIGQKDIKQRHATYQLIDEGHTFFIKLNGSVQFWTSDDERIRKALKSTETSTVRNNKPYNQRFFAIA